LGRYIVGFGEVTIKEEAKYELRVLQDATTQKRTGKRKKETLKKLGHILEHTLAVSLGKESLIIF
jgi:hypothetical protein